MAIAATVTVKASTARTTSSSSSGLIATLFSATNTFTVFRHEWQCGKRLKGALQTAKFFDNFCEISEILLAKCSGQVKWLIFECNQLNYCACIKFLKFPRCGGDALGNCFVWPLLKIFETNQMSKQKECF